jgi:hypothetical protein
MKAQSVNNQNLGLIESNSSSGFPYFDALPEEIKCHIIEQHAIAISDLGEPIGRSKRFVELATVNKFFHGVLTGQVILIWTLKNEHLGNWAKYILSRSDSKIAPDQDDSKALVVAAKHQYTSLCEKLLHWPTHRAHADARDSKALYWAALRTDPSLCALLLSPHVLHPARANARENQALIFVAYGYGCGLDDLDDADHGHFVKSENAKAMQIAQLLLNQNQHPATADARDSQALICAAESGFESMCRLLLEFPVNPARANAQNSKALVLASKSRGDRLRNYAGICKLLLTQKHHPAKADDQQSLALINASKIPDNILICRLLLQQKHHPARIEADHFKALEVAASLGNLTLCRFLLPEASAKGLTSKRLLEIAENPNTHRVVKACFLDWNKRFHLW